MTSETSPAPVATPAREIDFANNPPAKQLRTVGLDDFPNKLVSRCACESVVPAKEFEIGIADASAHQSNHRIALRPARLRHLPYRGTTLLKVDRNHLG